MGRAAIDADEVLWTDLRRRGIENLDEVRTAELVDIATEYAIWLPAAEYERAPWLAPYAIRRVRHRTDPRAPGPKRDLWGMPDEQGYFTDDNSLIKAIVKGRSVMPGDGPYGDSPLGTGLICCHVWAGTTADPLLFSFIPNLVWLPKSLAGYSDAHTNADPHELHEVLKVISADRFRSRTVEAGEARAAAAWGHLPVGTAEPVGVGVELDIGRRASSLAQKRVTKLINFLTATLALSGPLPPRFSKRYHAGVGPRIDRSVWPVQEAVSPEARTLLVEDMRSCLAGPESGAERLDQGS